MEQLRPQVLDSVEFGRKCRPAIDGFVRELKMLTELPETNKVVIIPPLAFDCEPRMLDTAGYTPFLTARLYVRRVVDLKQKLSILKLEFVALLEEAGAVSLGGLKVVVAVDLNRFFYTVHLALPFYV